MVSYGMCLCNGKPAKICHKVGKWANFTSGQFLLLYVLNQIHRAPEPRMYNLLDVKETVTAKKFVRKGLGETIGRILDGGVYLVTGGSKRRS